MDYTPSDNATQKMIERGRARPSLRNATQLGRDRLAGLLNAALCLALAVEPLWWTLTEFDAQSGIYVGIHLVAAFLLATRDDAAAVDRRSTTRAIVLASMVYIYGLNVDGGEGGSLLARVGCVLTLGASLASLAVLVSLGPAFGYLPALRRVVGSGPYSLVRHPLYASYMLADVGMLLTYPRWGNALLCAVGWTLLAARAVLEERLLAADEDFRAYCLRVRFRLVPGLL